MRGYYYLHANGSLIRKHENYQFEGPVGPDCLIREIWEFDTRYRADAWKIVTEALYLGADIQQVRSLAGKWDCDLRDCMEYIRRNELNEFEVRALVRFSELIFGLSKDQLFFEAQKEIRKLLGKDVVMTGQAIGVLK